MTHMSHSALRLTHLIKCSICSHQLRHVHLHRLWMCLDRFGSRTEKDVRVIWPSWDRLVLHYTFHVVAEQILDVPVLETVEQSVKLPNNVPQDRIRQRTVELVTDILVPQDMEELARFFKVSFLDRVQQSSAEQTIETPDITPGAMGLSLRRNRSWTRVFSMSSHCCRSLRKPLRS